MRADKVIELDDELQELTDEIVENIRSVLFVPDNNLLRIRLEGESFSDQESYTLGDVPSDESPRAREVLVGRVSRLEVGEHGEPASEVLSAVEEVRENKKSSYFSFNAGSWVLYPNVKFKVTGVISEDGDERVKTEELNAYLTLRGDE